MPTIHVHIHLHGEGFDMREAIERLQQEVEDTKNVNASARTLLGGLAQQIRDAQGDAATLNALADSLDAEQQLWAAAIEANQVPTAAPPADPPAEDGGNPPPDPPPDTPPDPNGEPAEDGGNPPPDPPPDTPPDPNGEV